MSSLVATGPASATISSGVVFNDTAGRPVHAHGAGLVLPLSHPASTGQSTFYMVGTSQKLPPNWLSEAINLYSSPDLRHWTFGRDPSRIAVRDHRNEDRTTQNPVQHMRASMSCGSTGRCVVWPGHGGRGHVRHHRRRLHVFERLCFDGLRSLDMTLFMTDASTAYLARSVDNQYAGFSRLTDDYLNTTDRVAQPQVRGHVSSATAVVPPMARLAGHAGSHLTGWHANPAILARAIRAASSERRGPTSATRRTRARTTLSRRLSRS